MKTVCGLLLFIVVCWGLVGLLLYGGFHVLVG